jgi:aspartate kinase
MASLGAKVLQARSVEFAKKYGVTVHVRSTFKPDPGTIVTKEESGMEEAVVTGITHDRSQAKVSLLRVPDRPGIAAQVFGAVAAKNVVVDMIVQNISRDGFTDISFTLPRGDHPRARTALGPSRGRSVPRASRTTSASPRSPSSGSACGATPASPRRCSPPSPRKASTSR